MASLAGGVLQGAEDVRRRARGISQERRTEAEFQGRQVDRATARERSASQERRTEKDFQTRHQDRVTARERAAELYGVDLRGRQRTERAAVRQEDLQEGLRRAAIVPAPAGPGEPPPAPVGGVIGGGQPLGLRDAAPPAGPAGTAATGGVLGVPSLDIGGAAPAPAEGPPQPSTVAGAASQGVGPAEASGRFPDSIVSLEQQFRYLSQKGLTDQAGKTLELLTKAQRDSAFLRELNHAKRKLDMQDVGTAYAYMWNGMEEKAIDLLNLHRAVGNKITDLKFIEDGVLRKEIEKGKKPYEYIDADQNSVMMGLVGKNMRDSMKQIQGMSPKGLKSFVRDTNAESKRTAALNKIVTKEMQFDIVTDDTTGVETSGKKTGFVKETGFLFKDSRKDDGSVPSAEELANVITRNKNVSLLKNEKEAKIEGEALRMTYADALKQFGELPPEEQWKVETSIINKSKDDYFVAVYTDLARAGYSAPVEQVLKYLEIVTKQKTAEKAIKDFNKSQGNLGAARDPDAWWKLQGVTVDPEVEFTEQDKLRIAGWTKQLEGWPTNRRLKWWKSERKKIPEADLRKYVEENLVRRGVPKVPVGAIDPQFRIPMF